MNRIEFMQELKIRLHRLPQDEFNSAINYYEEYFDDAGMENEQSVISELRSPANVASEIIADFAIKDMKASEPSAKKGLSTVWLIIIAIFASPIALPLAFAVVMVIFAVIICIFAFLLSFGVVGIALAAVGIASILSGLILMISDFATSIFFMGVGLLSIGLGIILTILVINLSKKCFGWLANNLSNFLKRRNKYEKRI